MKFSPANAKTQALAKVKDLKPFLKNRKIYSFDLLSGHTCPSAKECKSSVIETTNGRKIKDGPNTLFRCFSASQEGLFTGVYNLRKSNTEILKIAAQSVNSAADTLQSLLPKNTGIVRWHVAGDFAIRNYFQAFLTLAARNPNILFYAYTKQLKLWLADKAWVDRLPNVVLTASYGGHCDDLIEKHNLRFAKVVYSKAEAKKLGLQIDHDDSHAANPKIKNQNFALLIHGTQPKNTEAAAAWQKIKSTVGGYSK